MKKKMKRNYINGETRNNLLRCLRRLVTGSIVNPTSPFASNDVSNIEYAKQLDLVKLLSNQGLASQV